MEISESTKISQLLKQHPASLEAIVSLSPKFEKLRNPLLRRVMAPRTSIATAAKMGGCSVADFFEKLAPLGFTASADVSSVEREEVKQLPEFLNTLRPEDVIVFDVRPVIASGNDPLKMIMEKVKTVSSGKALKIVNSFEPTPLILLLEKQGFQVHVDEEAEDVIATYFYKSDNTPVHQTLQTKNSDDWDAVLQSFAGNLVTIDVRALEMPGPMMKILETLDTLAPNQALFVHHKRIPVFLLPELAERGLDYRIHTIAEGDVKMLIYQKKNAAT